MQNCGVLDHANAEIFPRQSDACLACQALLHKIDDLERKKKHNINSPTDGTSLSIWDLSNMIDFEPRPRSPLSSIQKSPACVHLSGS
jgi:hypothetical protein